MRRRSPWRRTRPVRTRAAAGGGCHGSGGARHASMLSFDNMTILPLAIQPFTPATDRDMLPSERRAFVRTHRTCIFGTARRADGPAMSVVYYVPTDDDELLVSTMRGRGKAKAVDRTGQASLCVLD